MYTLFFFKPLLDANFPVIAMKRFDFKNSIIATNLFLDIVLNQYLTSEWSQSKSDFVV